MRFQHTANQKQIDSQSGFTLVEVLVAMALFMVAIGGTLAMHGRSVENNQISLISTRVTNMAYEQMDNLIALPYNDPLLRPGRSAAVPFAIEEHNVEGEMFWTVYTEGNAIRNTKMVSLNIFWRRGDEHAQGPYTLTFLKAEML